MTGADAIQRMVAELTGLESREKPPSEIERDGAMRRCPMRSLSSLAKRPIQPLWQSLPAIERFLAPLGKDGRMSRSNWHSEINRETINVGSDGDEQ